MISNYSKIKPSLGLCKSNNSLIKEENFTGKLKNFVENLKDEIDSENCFDDQVK